MTSLTIFCRAALGRDPSRPAIEFEGVWHDWRAVRDVADEVDALLVAAGIDAGTPVGFVPRNRPPALAALTGMLATGRSIAMVHAYQSPSAIAASLGEIAVGAVILMAEDATPAVTDVLAARGIAGIVLDTMAASAMHGLSRGVSLVDPGPPRVEILTSGTTGPPKRFALPHAVIAQFVDGQGLSLLDDPDRPPFLLSFPLGNISGIYSVAASLFRGERVVLLDRFSVAAWHDYVRRWRPATGGAPPAAVAMIVDADLPRDDLASLRYFGTGAAPLDPVIQRRFEEKYGIPVLLSYGATEFGGPVAAWTPALHAQWGATKLGSVGRAMPGVELRVRDRETGALLGPGHEGLLEVVAPRMGPDWIATADIAMLDADGFLFHRGRADGAIMRGGFKILPETIERVLTTHPNVAAAAVVALPDRRVGQVPGAVIEPRAAAGVPPIADLEALVRHHLPATHVPAQWRIVASLPKNPSFKIDRPALMRLFDAGADSDGR